MSFREEGGYPFYVKRDFFRMSESGKLLRAKKKLAKIQNKISEFFAPASPNQSVFAKGLYIMLVKKKGNNLE